VNGDSTMSAAATFTSAGIRVRLGASAMAGDAALTAESECEFVGASAMAGIATLPAVSYIRIRNVACATSGAAAVVAVGRKKWEDDPDTPESWAPIADTAETWTPIADTAETWTEKTHPAYLQAA
jgi:hypothetical protein